jgi:two-component system cell cycle sensor histidine kinase/response regulator CckA
MGTTFKIYLPQVDAMETVAAASSADARDARGSETVLLVEDHDAVRRLAHLTLERAGYRVLDATNPRDALLVATAFSDEIHLILSDIVMPESDGPPLLDRLRPTRSGLRVLYMSGYADEAIVRLGILAEDTPFLQKPFTPRSLAAKVREVLDAPK